MRRVGLGEERADRGVDHLGRRLRHAGEHVTHEVHTAALPARTDEHRTDRWLEPEVMVGDRQLHTRQSTGAQALAGRGRERAVFAVADVGAEHFPLASHGDTRGDDHRPGHDPAAHAVLDVGGVQEHVDELGVIEPPVPEHHQVPVELAADCQRIRVRPSI